ncbi:protein fosB isoform X2 [Protopterus annectens]|nr:protein fosB isoform X2 [Protopterus annectens]
MPSSFVPTVTAITTSQDLQWLVQPTLISSVAQSQPLGQTMSHTPALDIYDLPGTSYSSPGMTTSATGESSVRVTRSRPRRAHDETLTPEEEEKRRVRRERNKLAAAKCRNRRRELTDRLQLETDQLEEEKAELEAEIADLRKEKERLEFVLVAHRQSCKIPYEEVPDPTIQASPSVKVSTLRSSIKEDLFGPITYPTAPSPYQQNIGTSVQGMASVEVAFSSSFCAHSEPLSDPYPSSSSYTSSFVFTYPEGSTCGATHQRNSSSDQSSDSLSSPSLLAL